MRDLTQHLTARADDSHAAPLLLSLAGRRYFYRWSVAVQAQVRFFALRRIEPHVPPLVRAPVNSFEFQSCDRTPQAQDLTRQLRDDPPTRATPSPDGLGLGLPGYLILFAPLAFVPQRQLRSSEPPSPRVFLQISTHFTATPAIPLTSLALEHGSFESSLWVKPRDFTPNLPHRLRTLYAQ